jgi:hypothetical protein
MRSYSSWLVLLCLSVSACSDDDSSSSEEAASASDAATSDKDNDKQNESDDDKGAGGRASGGAGGSKAASGSGDEKSGSDASDGEGKPDDAKSDEAKGSDDKQGESSGGDAPQGESKTDDGQATSAPPTTGDQLSLCTRAQGDCNRGLACQAPASSALSPGRGYCSKICESDADCSGLAPEGTQYTCSPGSGTKTCEIACSGADDSSCPSGLRCVQTGRRLAAAESGDAGTPSSAFEEVFSCLYPFEVSKTWGQCGDSSHVCDEGLRCSGFWFGAGHCTHSCESDADCEKPESGETKPTCVTLVPAIGDSAAVKQCALECSQAKDGCPNALACIEGRRLPPEEGMESAPAPAWCQ